MIEDGTISGGMIPKIESCLDVIAEGVEAVVIINGKVPHAVLLELFTEHGAGTLIERRRAQRHRARSIMMARKPLTRRDFSHVEAWVFDLDNTLYPADCNLFAEIDTRMGDFIAERFGVSHEEAQRMRKTYYYQYGTTLAGLMRCTTCRRNAFLDYVHDIDLSVIAPAPDLRERRSTRCPGASSSSPTARAATPSR